VSDSGESGLWSNETFFFKTRSKVSGPYPYFPELENEFVAIPYNDSCWDAVPHGPHTLDPLILNKNGYKYWAYYGCRSSTSGIGVAYSNDLVNWTRYNCSEPLIQSHRWPTVGIQNDTIHLFYRGVYRATSPVSDGINFTVQEQVTSGGVTPFLFKNPVDDEWWLFWVSPTSTFNAKHAKDIRDLDEAPTIIVRQETTINAWAPSVFYWNNTFYFTQECEPGGVWVERAFYNDTLGPNCFNDATECPNSPVPMLSTEDACGMAHMEGNQLYYYWSYKFDHPSDLWDVRGATSVKTRETSPIVRDEIPVDDSVNSSVSPVLSVFVTDLQGDDMDVVFMTNASGSWETIGENVSVSDGRVSCDNTSVMSGYGMSYWWRVCVVDSLGSGSWTNMTYRFSTFAVGDLVLPMINDVNLVISDPKDTSIGWVNISCTVTDDVGVDVVKVNITYPDAHSENVSMTGSGDTYYYNSTFSNIGSYSYQVWAEDTSDNVNMSSVDGFVMPPNWDITGDGVCNGIDVTWVSIYWMNSGDPGWIRADITNDGWVNGIDITYVSLHWMETWS